MRSKSRFHPANAGLSISERPRSTMMSPLFSQFFLGCVAVAGIFGLLTVGQSLPFAFSSLRFALPFVLQLGLGLLALVLLRNES